MSLAMGMPTSILLALVFWQAPKAMLSVLISGNVAPLYVQRAIARTDLAISSNNHKRMSLTWLSLNTHLIESGCIGGSRDYFNFLSHVSNIKSSMLCSFHEPCHEFGVHVFLGTVHFVSLVSSRINPDSIIINGIPQPYTRHV